MLSEGISDFSKGDLDSSKRETILFLKAIEVFTGYYTFSIFTAELFHLI